MPGIQDWRMTPLQNVSQIYEEHIKNRQPQASPNVERGINQLPAESNWKDKVSEFFGSKLNVSAPGTEWRKQIPSINVTPNHLLTDGQLVRFQGMIQVRY